MISRRSFLGVSLIGAMCGLIASSRSRAEASIRFIGRRETIIALLDTGSERVLFLLGEQDDELLASIPGLTTIGNSRIDLVVGTHRLLSTRAAREHLHLDSTRAVAIQADASLPPIRGEISTVTETIELQLGDMTSIQITPLVRPDDHPDFSVTIRHRDVSIALVSGEDALRHVDIGAYALLAIPGRPGIRATSTVQPQLIVCNSPNLEDVAINQMAVYRDDPQVVRIDPAGIRIRDDQLFS